MKDHLPFINNHESIECVPVGLSRTTALSAESNLFYEQPDSDPEIEEIFSDQTEFDFDQSGED